MTLNEVKVWKFGDAPRDLQALHPGGDAPRWLAWVPAAIHGADLLQAIRVRSGPSELSASRTEAGDIVYAGSSGLKIFMEAITPYVSDYVNPKSEHRV
jgi:hypothetical protein